MRKLILILIVLFAAGALFAGGEEETEEIHELILIDTGSTPWNTDVAVFDTGGTDSFQHLLLEKFLEDNPNVRVEYLHRDITQGSMTVDALMAKGTPPDVWLDAGGYFIEYMNPEYALPIEQYMDVSIYQDHLLTPYTIDGHVYAIPMSNIALGMAVNLTMLDEIGYTLPPLEDWTIEEFTRLAKRLKEAGYPAAMIMTNHGMFSWMMAWLYAFGAEMFAPGDYSQTTINTPEALAGLEYIKMLVDEGYAPPYPNELTADSGVEYFTTGKVFSVMLQKGHVTYWLPQQVEAGAIDEEFEYTFIEFPHVAGRDHTPVDGYQTAVIAHRSDNEARNLAVIELFKNRVGADYQNYVTALQGGFPTIKDFQIRAIGHADSDSYRAIAALAATAGLMDLGSLNPRANEAMETWTIPLQEYMADEISAQELLDIVEAEANAILAD